MRLSYLRARSVAGSRTLARSREEPRRHAEEDRKERHVMHGELAGYAVRDGEIVAVRGRFHSGPRQNFAENTDVGRRHATKAAVAIPKGAELHIGVCDTDERVWIFEREGPIGAIR